MNITKLLKPIQKLLPKIGSLKFYLLIAVLAYLVLNYNSLKSMVLGGMQNQSSEKEGDVDVGANNFQPSEPMGQNAGPAEAAGVSSSVNGAQSNCARQSVNDPKDLLPADENTEFSKLNPMGSGDLMNVNLLKAGHHIGINTVGTSLRNANLQVRSEPANPRVETGPWNNSTIEADNFRKSLEIGSH